MVVDPSSEFFDYLKSSRGEVKRINNRNFCDLNHEGLLVRTGFLLRT